MPRSYKIPLSKPYFPRSALSSDNLEFWIGRQEQIDRVVRGLLAATEAHYLITGYPGVGKSSFVSRVISEWRKLSAANGICRVLIFNLHFAQPQTPEEIVKKLIGKVYFGSIDGQFSPTKKLAERLQLNYVQAHSTNLTETQAETTSKESGREATVSLPQAATFFGGTIGASSKKSVGVSHSLEIHKEYNLSMATNEFESVLHLLMQTESFQAGFFERFKKKIFRARSTVISSRVLFVFDQIDDLKFVQELSSFFNLPNAAFIVLGGIKLREQISSAKDEGIHTLDNFDEIYLSCQWDKAKDVLPMLVDRKMIGDRRYANYVDYLNFCSQGLPRRLFAAIDKHTKRQDNEFYLGISLADQKRIKLCAELHRILWKHRKDILGPFIDSVQTYLRDKSLRGAYHLTDRIFRVAKFSFQDANTVATQISAAIIHPKRELMLRNLLRVFELHGLIVKDGNTYSLSETILNLVKQIPDWLKDGYVDAREFINEVRDFDDRDVTSFLSIPTKEDPTGVDVRHFDTQRVREGLEKRPGAVPPAHGEEEQTTGPDFRKLASGQYLEGQSLGGRYIISKALGRGGMSSVYLAHDSKLLGKPVAIKIMLDRVVDNEWVMTKFKQEMEALVRVEHPCIVRILDTGKTDNGDPYFVMEFVEGVTLRSVLTVDGLSLKRIDNIVKQLTSALEAAHQHGIIHRDLKPENIMIQSSRNDEQVRVIDFGIAKVMNSVIAPTTATGNTAGTILYMSPEQLLGGAITVASDIYALGLNTYEMVTGHRPFNPETSFQLLELQRAGVKIMPRDLCPSLPESAQVVILKALNFNPSERYRSAADFGKDFNNALTC